MDEIPNLRSARGISCIPNPEIALQIVIFQMLLTTIPFMFLNVYGCLIGSSKHTRTEIIWIRSIY